MVQTCSAYGCKNRYHKEREISFHKFPLARPDICGQWVAAMRRNNFRPTKYSNICSQHFTDDCFKGECNNRVLKENAVPSLFAFSLSIKSEPLENPFPSEIHFPLSLPLTTDPVMAAAAAEEEEEEEEEEPQPEQGKSAADVLGDTATVSCDHNYTAEDSVRQTRRIKYLEDQLERLRKKMKSTQQRCRRQERQLSRLKAICKLPKSSRPVPMPFGQDYVIVPKQMYNNLSGIE